MAGFSSFSSFKSALETSGQIGEINFSSTTESNSSALAGWWQDLFTNKSAPIQPVNMTFSGTAGVAVAMNNSTAGCLPINYDVSPAKRYLIDAQFTFGTSSAVAPCTIYLVDLLLYYPSLNIQASPTTLVNTIALPRYTNGIGVQVITTTTTPLATTNPTLTFTYTDSASNSTTGSTTAVNVNQSASTLWLSGNSAAPASQGPFLPMGSSGQGIKSIQSYTISNGTATGAVAAILCKPLMAFSIPYYRLGVEKDMIFQFPSLPQIQDGACLGLIMSYAGAGSTIPIQVRLRYGWL